MDAIVYVDILEKTLLPMIKKLYPNGHRFIQDNEPKHTSSRLDTFSVIMESTGGIPHLSLRTVIQPRTCDTKLKST